jgi:hypothetical protein
MLRCPMALQTQELEPSYSNIPVEKSSRLEAFFATTVVYESCFTLGRGPTGWTQ